MPIPENAIAGAGTMLPFDEHNRKLLANVHPPNWRNPKPAGRYHLVVIGGGTGGLVTAAIASALGARVALVERHLLGGDCLNVGCVPSKSLVEAARSWHTARTAERSGGPSRAGDAGSFAAVMERMRRIRAEISAHDSAFRFRDLGVDVFLGEASFSAEDAVQLDDGATLRFRRAVIATGGRPAVPSVSGLHAAGYLTNETVFSLTALPQRLAVMGGGPIGCELAQVFARFGSNVIMIEAAGRILTADDSDAAEVVADSLRRDGVEILCNADLRAVRGDAGVRHIELESGGRAAVRDVDAVLVAAGRAPNVAALRLAAAGVEYDEAAGIAVDDRMRTSNPRVFAIGDVASKHRFTHAADAQARVVVRNALFYGRGKASELLVPWCTYTQPELAHVGITAADVAARDDIDTETVQLAELDRARLAGETHGFLRIHLKKGAATILGATLVAPHAGDIISQITQAMTTRTSLAKLGEVIFPYPTFAEVLRKAADQHRRRRLTPRVSRAFSAWFRWVG